MAVVRLAAIDPRAARSLALAARRAPPRRGGAPRTRPTSRPFGAEPLAPLTRGRADLDRTPPGFELTGSRGDRDRRRDRRPSATSGPRARRWSRGSRPGATTAGRSTTTTAAPTSPRSVIDDRDRRRRRGVAQPAGRGQARPRLRGRGRRQRQRGLDLDPALHPLRPAVLRSEATVPAPPPRPAGPALVLGLAVLLQQGRDRLVGAARLPGPRLPVRADADRRVPAARAGGPADPRGPDALARDRGGRPGRLPDRDERRRLAGDRHRLRQRRRRRPDRRRRRRLRRSVHAADRPRRLLRARSATSPTSPSSSCCPGTAASRACPPPTPRRSSSTSPSPGCCCSPAGGCARGAEGRDLGIALAFAWLAYPYTLYALDANGGNDALVAALLVAALIAFASPLKRGLAIGARRRDEVRAARAGAAVRRRTGRAADPLDR